MLLNKKTFATIFICILVLEIGIGLLSNVTLLPCLMRAFFGAALFTGILWGSLKFIRNCVIQDLIKEAEEEEKSKHQIDITVADDTMNLADLYNDEAETETLQKDADEQAAVSDSNQNEFTPLTSQQIDPQVNKIINDNPERLAQIVRKMGFEDET